MRHKLRHDISTEKRINLWMTAALSEFEQGLEQEGQVASVQGRQLQGPVEPDV